jgi:SAM-dependent methyltransferase
MGIEERIRDWRALLVIGGAMRAGILEVLADRELSAKEIASMLSASERAVWVTTEALVDVECLERGNGTYRLREDARQLLFDENNPRYLRRAMMHQYNLVGRWLQLPQVIKEGKPQPGGRRGLEETADFIGAMARGASGSAAFLADLCLQRSPQAKSMLDVGGGPGIHALEFARRGLAATVYDLPPVIELDRQHGLERQGVSLVAGDFNQSLPPGPFDLALLSSICHIYGPEKNTALFQRTAASLAPNGVIAVVDFVRGISPAAPLFGVNMLVGTEEGGTWTEEEYRRWLAAAGFVDVQITNVGGPGRQLITARRAP